MGATHSMTPRSERILKFYRTQFTYLFGPREGFYHALIAFVDSEIQIALNEAKQKEVHDTHF